jgi:hypothetical protein
VDLHRFRRLMSLARESESDQAASDLIAEALGLWRGEPFAGLDTPWLASTRQLLLGERFAAELERNDVLLRLGRHGELVPALSAAVAAVALSAGPLVPRAVLRLAGLPRPVVPADAAALVAADEGPDLLPPGELAARSGLARGQLAGLVSGLAVSAAVAAPPAATAGGWAGPALAAVVVVVLLLRAQGFADAGPARVHVAAGIATGVALVGLAALAAGPAGRPVGALVLLGTAGLGAAAVGRSTRALSPVARRALDIAEGVLTAAALPLAVVASGAFALVRTL